MKILNTTPLLFLLSLALSFSFLTQHAAHADGLFAFNPKKVVLQKAITFRPNHPFRLFFQDLYDVLVRKGLVSSFVQMLVEEGNENGSSVYHRIARGWHRLLFRHLRVAEFPEAWREAAASVHKRFGGQGDLRNAFIDTGEKRGSFNIKTGKLKSEFLDLAIFSLWANVPEGIGDCGPEESYTAIACVMTYAGALRAALRATLLTFYRFIVPRYPSSRIAAASFVVAVVSPCPFGYLTEPRVVLAAMREDEEYLLDLLSSPKKGLRAEPCKEMKMAMLKLLLKEGVTPGDYIKKTNLDEELKKFEGSMEKLIENEDDGVRQAALVSRSTLLKPAKKKEEKGGKDGKKGDKKEGKKDKNKDKEKEKEEDDDDKLYQPGGVYDALEDYLTNGPINHYEYFFRSLMGQDAKAVFNSRNSTRRGPYTERLRVFLEDKFKNPLEGVGKDMSFQDERVKLKKYLEEEAKENPQKIPLRRGNQPPEKEVRNAMYLARNFRGPKKHFEVPKDDEEEEKKK